MSKIFFFLNIFLYLYKMKGRKYKKQYIYPPRPENKIKPVSLNKYDTDEYLCEPKLDGSNCTLYIGMKSFSQRNRHQGTITNFKMDEKEILNLQKGKGEIVLVGEYMNKSKKGTDGKLFNKKFVIFDILVYEDMYLVGTTFEERYELIKSIYELKEYDDYLFQISENVFFVKSFKDKFEKRFNSIIKVDMLEGFVLKRKNAKLERGTRQKNNVNSQLKVRKPTLNYQF